MRGDVFCACRLGPTGKMILSWYVLDMEPIFPALNVGHKTHIDRQVGKLFQPLSSLSPCSLSRSQNDHDKLDNPVWCEILSRFDAGFELRGSKWGRAVILFQLKSEARSMTKSQQMSAHVMLRHFYDIPYETLRPVTGILNQTVGEQYLVLVDSDATSTAYTRRITLGLCCDVLPTARSL
ncbi:hypothetical protein BDQ17DRAFT_825901 [Cyathus striatus]|nr:hypothetical protein BDQ17DRAFT_825901 [Cyathus striatus]